MRRRVAEQIQVSLIPGSWTREKVIVMVNGDGGLGLQGRMGEGLGRKGLGL